MEQKSINELRQATALIQAQVDRSFKALSAASGGAESCFAGLAGRAGSTKADDLAPLRQVVSTLSRQVKRLEFSGPTLPTFADSFPEMAQQMRRTQMAQNWKPSLDTKAQIPVGRIVITTKKR